MSWAASAWCHLKSVVHVIHEWLWELGTKISNGKAVTELLIKAQVDIWWRSNRTQTLAVCLTFVTGISPRTGAVVGVILSQIGVVVIVYRSAVP